VLKNRSASFQLVLKTVAQASSLPVLFRKLEAFSGKPHLPCPAIFWSLPTEAFNSRLQKAGWISSPWQIRNDEIFRTDP